jgi:type VI secretion system protein ImpJ
MTARDVHWHEGMFLRPQHFQAGRDHLVHLMAVGQKWDQHYNWGLRAIDIDRDALANHRFVARRLRARLHDGTPINVPEDGLLPELDLKPAMERDSAVTILLAVPMLRLGRANVADTSTDGARYLVDSVELEDENTGTNPQPVQVRHLNIKLVFSTQDQTGYAVLPLARVERADRAEGLPQLHLPYIPPVVACDAWAPLSAGILQSVHDRIGKKLELLSAQIASRGIAFGSQAAGDALILGQMCVLNEAYALFGILAYAEGVHPLTAYWELCRLVGQLAIFGEGRRTPELPRYDHDDLGGCFYRVRNYLDDLFDKIIEPDYKERPFEGAGLRMQVTLEPAWLAAANQMYVGVRSPLPPDECVRLLKPGGLDMKIGSSERVDRIFQFGQAGLTFSYCPVPPRALPAGAGLTYFQINREAMQEEWQHVQKSLTLAIRLNEHRIVGNIEGQRILTIRTTGTQTTTLQFTLYVVRGEK